MQFFKLLFLSPHTPMPYLNAVTVAAYKMGAVAGLAAGGGAVLLGGAAAYGLFRLVRSGARPSPEWDELSDALHRLEEAYKLREQEFMELVDRYGFEAVCRFSAGIGGLIGKAIRERQ